MIPSLAFPSPHPPQGVRSAIAHPFLPPAGAKDLVASPQGTPQGVGTPQGSHHGPKGVGRGSPGGRACEDALAEARRELARVKEALRGRTRGGFSAEELAQVRRQERADAVYAAEDGTTECCANLVVEDQDEAKCAKHAINNLLQRNVATDTNLNHAASVRENIEASLRHADSDQYNQGRDNDWDFSAIDQWFQLRNEYRIKQVFPPWVPHKIPPINNDDLIGFIVNEGGHFIALRADHLKQMWCWMDSIGREKSCLMSDQNVIERLKEVKSTRMIQVTRNGGTAASSSGVPSASKPLAAVPRRREVRRQERADAVYAAELAARARRVQEASDAALARRLAGMGT